MRRDSEAFLDKWLVNKNRKPLLIYGARQIGKTYLVNDLFMPKHFDDKHYVHVDFKFDHDERKYIKNHINSDDIIKYLSLKRNIKICENTLIFFDEIQECLPAITSLKSFKEKHPNIPVIATGSLVRTKIKQMEASEKIFYDPEILLENQDGHNNYMFPLGKIDEYNMYPCTFNEFLYAANSSLYDFIKESFKVKKVLDNHYHSLALKYINDYLLIGGLPENIEIYLNSNSYEESRKNLITLYNNYLNDMVLYQLSQNTIIRSRMVYDNIYSQLNKENKNYKISDIEKNKKYRDYQNPFFWLISANLVYPSYQLKEKVSLPLHAKEDSLFRIFLPDTGLFSYQSRIDQDSFIDEMKVNTLSGIFYENFIACELKARNIDLFYWKGKTSSELEFLIQYKDIVIPIDVKKNKGNMKSIEKFRELNTNSIAIKVSNNKYGYNNENKLITIPYYYFGFLIENMKWLDNE